MAAPAAAATTHQVDIQAFAFSPLDITICLGDKVQWTNLDTAPHTATSSDGWWDSGTLTTGNSFTWLFDKVGDFEYFCSIHAGMTHGMIRVRSLTADNTAIPSTAPSTTNFMLCAGPANAGRNYMVFGSVSGTMPGTPLPGGIVTLPLNWDVFTNLVLSLANTPVFPDFLGTLDANGEAMPKMVFASPPGGTGVILYFAAALNAPWNFVTDPVKVEILP